MWLIYDIETGEIISVQTQGATAPGMGAVYGADFTVDMIEQYWVNQGELTLRPAPPIFLSNGIAPLDIDLSVLAEGSEVIIYNSELQSMQIIDFTEPLTLTGADTYLLTAHQIYPHHSVIEHVIEVTSA